MKAVIISCLYFIAIVQGYTQRAYTNNNCEEAPNSATIFVYPSPDGTCILMGSTGTYAKYSCGSNTLTRWICTDAACTQCNVAFTAAVGQCVNNPATGTPSSKFYCENLKPFGETRTKYVQPGCTGPIYSQVFSENLVNCTTVAGASTYYDCVNPSLKKKYSCSDTKCGTCVSLDEVVDNTCNSDSEIRVCNPIPRSSSTKTKVEVATILVVLAVLAMVL
jgi:hypothetical protein